MAGDVALQNARRMAGDVVLQNELLKFASAPLKNMAVAPGDPHEIEAQRSSSSSSEGEADDSDDDDDSLLVRALRTGIYGDADAMEER